MQEEIVKPHAFSGCHRKAVSRDRGERPIGVEKEVPYEGQKAPAGEPSHQEPRRNARQKEHVRLQRPDAVQRGAQNEERRQGSDCAEMTGTLPSNTGQHFCCLDSTESEVRSNGKNHHERAGAFLADGHFPAEGV